MESIARSLAFDPKIFLAQIVVFIALLIVMNALFWKPLLAALRGRDQKIADAYRQRDALQHEMETLRADYMSRLGQIEAEARHRIQTAIKEAQTERERLLAEAREQSDAAIRQGIADMEREKIESLTSLRERMVGLALTAVGKALGPAADMTAIRRSVEERIQREVVDGRTPARN